MAGYSGLFTNSLVVIYDADQNFIAKTEVTGHNRDELYIEVMEGLEDARPGMRLNLLIIHPGGVSELSGVYRSFRQGIFEILIYGERPRDARGTLRHDINTKAVVRHIIVDSEEIDLVDPVNIVIENISASGVLINSPELQFISDVILRIEFSIRDRNTIIFAKVLREQADGDGPPRYGCQLVFFS